MYSTSMFDVNYFSLIVIFTKYFIHKLSYIYLLNFKRNLRIDLNEELQNAMLSIGIKANAKPLSCKAAVLQMLKKIKNEKKY